MNQMFSNFSYISTTFTLFTLVQMMHLCTNFVLVLCQHLWKKGGVFVSSLFLWADFPQTLHFIYIGIWILQILILPNLYFKNMKESVSIMLVLDPLWSIVNPNFVMLQQKNFVAQEITSYATAFWLC